MNYLFPQKVLSILLMMISIFSYGQKKQNYIESANGVSFEMIFVKGGSFEMGDRVGDLTLDSGINPCLPIHRVTIKNLFVGKLEVTQELWQAVMGTNPSEQKMEEHPVETVSWDDCQLFLQKLNTATGKQYRLLTEAEFEYVVRGGKKVADTNAANENIQDRAWIAANTDERGHQAVGTKQPNNLGIYDLQGNVWEWVNDWYSETSYKQSVASNPQGIQNGKEKVFRGGSFKSEEVFTRPSYRNYDTPDAKHNFIGLRVARSL